MPASVDTWTELSKQYLIGHGLRLEPLTEAHAAELMDIVDPESFRYLLATPDPWSVVGFQHYIKSWTGPGFASYAVRVALEGQIAGISSYLTIQPEHRSIEIGHTLYGVAFRGSWVNPACKLLLFKYAFETLGAHRVQLKCDALNERSRAAILKAGAKFEGVLRNHMVVQGGRLRDTAMFSVIADEWPVVKQGLADRVKLLQGT